MRKSIVIFILIIFYPVSSGAIDTVHDREIERQNRIANIEKTVPVSRPAQPTKPGYTLKDLADHTKTMSDNDWKSLRNLENCLAKVEEEQLGGLFAGLMSFNLTESIFAIGEAMFNEIKGSDCHEKNQLTHNAATYKNIYTSLTRDQIRNQKNAARDIL
ncbi:MAG: hypothetical protein ABFR97_04265 [Thermodesulfobacteriota bacterium]